MVFVRDTKATPVGGRAAAAILAAVLAMALAGVVGSAACQKQAGGPPGVRPVIDARAEAGARGKPFRIGMIGKSASNPAFLSARRGAEDKARTLSQQVGSPIEIVWLTPAQEDARVQAQRIVQAVNERVDAVLISCSDDQQVSAAIDDAVARGVPVMTFDSDAPGSRRFAHCGIDDFAVGQRLMTELAELLASRRVPAMGPGSTAGEPSRRPPPPGQRAKVAILAGNRAAPNLRRRLEGVMKEASRHPEVKVVGAFFHVETAPDASAEVMRAVAAHGDLEGWVMLGGWPLYNTTLLRDMQSDAARTRFTIVAMDALPPQLIYVDKGFAPVVLGQPAYLWGAVGVEGIVKRVLLQQPVPEHLPLEPVRVTSANLGSWARQLKTWGFADVPDEYLTRP